MGFKMKITPKMMLFLLAAICCAWPHTATAEFHLTAGHHYHHRPTTTPAPLAPAECADATSCEECTGGRGRTAGLTCHWAAALQACAAGDGGGTGNLTASRAADCPATAVAYDGRAYRVTVTNDAVGLLAYMARAGAYCSRGWLTGVPGRAARVTVSPGGRDGSVTCADYPLRPGSEADPASVSGMFYVTFGPDRVQLRTADRSDYYASHMYDRECGRYRSEYCVGCLRVNEEKRFYAQWCPRRSHCVDWMVNNTGAAQEYPQVKMLDQDEEQESRCDVPARIVSVQPSWLPWDSDETTVTIEITGHSTLAHNTTVSVTLAGRSCERPRHVAPDTFSCTMYGTMVPANIRGPVRVDYGPVYSWMHVGGVAAVARMRNAVASPHSFRFYGPGSVPCTPRPKPADPVDGYRGTASGGSMMTVVWTGLHCVDPSAITEIALYGDRRGSGIQHYALCAFGVDDDDVGTMVCHAPPVVGPRGPPSAVMVEAQERAWRENRTDAIGNFRCGFRLRAISGEQLNVPCAADNRYTVYPDPVFRGFNVTADGEAVIILGHGLGRGYGPGDVTVRFASGTAGRCTVQQVYADRIECTVIEYMRAHVRDVLRSIWVNVGSVPTITVNKIE